MALTAVTWNLLMGRQVRQRRQDLEVLDRKEHHRRRQHFRHQEGCQQRQPLQAEAEQEL